MNSEHSTIAPLPVSVDQISCEWLDAALSSWTPGVRVAAIEGIRVVPGTATKVMLHVRFDRNVPNGPPDKLCLKGGFDEQLRGIVGEAYCTEANFYAHVARLVSVPTPRCWFAHSEPEKRQGVIILDDLGHAGAQFGEPTEPWPAAQVAAALEAMAQWHGPTWASPRSRFPWLPETCALRTAASWLLGEENWRRTLSEPFADQVPESLRDSALVKRTLFDLWARDDASVPCLAHLDPHVGNTYVGPDGEPRFLDWQVVNLAPGVDDVSYFIVGAMDIEERRQHEQDLVRQYLDALARCGGPRLDFHKYWEDYRRHQLHGLLWAATPPMMQPFERVQAMAIRHLSALKDHETIQLLKSA